MALHTSFCVFLTRPHQFFSALLCSGTRTCVSCPFWVLVLESSILSGKPSSLHWVMIFRKYMRPLWSIKGKLSGQKIKRKGEPHPVLLVNHNEVCPNVCRSGKNSKLISLWGWLKQQAYRAYACVLPHDSSSYDHTFRQLNTKQKYKRERKSMKKNGLIPPRMSNKIGSNNKTWVPHLE